MKIKILVLFKIFLLFTSGCYLVSATDVFADVATMELLQFLKRFNKKWYFICTIYYLTLFFTNHSYFDLENACGIYDEDMEKSLMPILFL